jgi:hypothetical protein
MEANGRILFLYPNDRYQIQMKKDKNGLRMDMDTKEKDTTLGSRLALQRTMITRVLQVQQTLASLRRISMHTTGVREVIMVVPIITS